ncbi:MAG: Asp-tRNA(Asn)/Glu-tRNA(Gln) amidotransferase subunit GatC [Holosporales bacterium]|jgi:aspartyl-tRNA(Asn)/glutamyl-tRNA(Gln) amidotransferase subunit C|nr:Asp-tRNA(Asn)/Glu-tRNA(Gln) amidotransferase subunit GatC [Holosporales bacterium]
MAVTIDTVRDIAKLASIRLADDELDYMAQELDSIVHWLDLLQEVDVSEIDLHAAFGESLREREDVAEPTPSADAILINAPDRVDSWFAVPKIIG